MTALASDWEACRVSASGALFDMALELGDVRYWMNSGKHMLALSFSAFDRGCVKTLPMR